MLDISTRSSLPLTRGEVSRVREYRSPDPGHAHTLPDWVRSIGSPEGSPDRLDRESADLATR
jgi:hypothetical protein